VLHGSLSYLLQDEDGQVQPAHSVSAGLDYPGVGPEHAHLKDSGRAEYVSVTDAQALDGFATLARLETAHAVGWLQATAERRAGSELVVLNVSGRGDKDVAHVAGRAGGAA
jgi:tryptophan synthase beta chain